MIKVHFKTSTSEQTLALALAARREVADNSRAGCKINGQFWASAPLDISLKLFFGRIR